jgi:hypothetical protein
MRALDDLTPVARYLDLKAEMEQLTDELEALKPILTDALLEEPGEVFAYRGFSFSLTRRRSYRYSDTVRQLEAEVKAMKQYEEATGVAQVERWACFPVVTKAKD